MASQKIGQKLDNITNKMFGSDISIDFRFINSLFHKLFNLSQNDAIFGNIICLFIRNF